MTLTFTIEGNQNDPTGNPIPYKRVLSGKFRKDSIDYMAWKEYVRSCLDRTAHLDGLSHKVLYVPATYPYPHILAQGVIRAAVHIKIYWKNHSHGDCDNVFKGILDALFENDKLVHAGSFESFYSPEKKGKVDISLVLE